MVSFGNLKFRETQHGVNVIEMMEDLMCMRIDFCELNKFMTNEIGVLVFTDQGDETSFI